MNIENYINSGILELYVLGIATPEEAAEVERLTLLHPEIKTEIDKLTEVIEVLAKKYSKKPHAASKALLLASIDYSERMKNGEAAAFPKELNEHSKIEEYKEWLDRKDLQPVSEVDGIFVKIIGYTPQILTAIVWIQELAPDEVHDNEYEKFLIVEGECDITVGNNVRHFVPGNYFSVPLHESHRVKVTSSIPCKVILQRVAA